MRIDVVIDIVCPWCAVGLWSLDAAIARSGMQADLHIQPFELNPDMPAEGENLVDHLGKKYGRSPLELAKTHEMIAVRGAAVGFTFDWEKRTHIYNTFDAHRLLYWASLEDREVVLARALMRAYHTEGRNISDVATLVAICSELNFDPQGARAVLETGGYGEEVRQLEDQWVQLDITGVPAVVIDEKHIISGAQPSPVYEAALRQLKS